MSLIDRILRRRPVASWTGGLPDRSAAEGDLLQALLARWQRYQAAEIDDTLSSEDDMVERDKLAHYRAVGVSALELITDAMVLARRTSFARVLDMPCGGGRVTRHLVKFFPDAEIFVSDIERKKQAFVAAQFGVTAHDLPADFSARNTARYDLIFVGSLLTHLDERTLRAAMDFFIDALAPQGVLIATTNGRQSATAIPESRKHMTNDPIAGLVAGVFQRRGFGFKLQDRRRYGVNYGTTFTTPSWLARSIEPRNDVMLLAIKERAWDYLQDALIVQKLP